jgi:poly(A) polymerase
MGGAATKSTAMWVVRRLREAGFEALLAGGCVRDMLLGRRSNDYDIATSATPKQVSRLFRRVLLIGAKFGVAMVLHKGRTVEVTTFRSDLSYSDGRRPDGVRFSTAREDAMRRDFTINGMFYDPVAREVIDYVGGRTDLGRELVRTIGRPDERFSEDYLRMIRAVRFAVRLGFRIAPATRQAVARHASKIASISGERIFDELSKMLAAPSAGEAAALLNKLGLARAILPELVDAGLWKAAEARIGAIPLRHDLTLAMGALLMDLPRADIRKRIRAWGAPNDLRDSLCFLATNRDAWGEATELPLCDFKRLLAAPDFPNLRTLWRIREKAETGRQTHARRIARRIAGIDPAQIAPDPLLTGDDLQNMGMRQSPALGNVLRTVYDAQLNEQITTRRDAKSLAEQMMNA